MCGDVPTRSLGRPLNYIIIIYWPFNTPVVARYEPKRDRKYRGINSRADVGRGVGRYCRVRDAYVYIYTYNNI